MSAYSQITPTFDANAHRQARLRAVYGGEPNVVDQSRVDKLISIFDKYAAKEAANGYNKLVIRLMQHRSDKHKVSLADIGEFKRWLTANGYTLCKPWSFRSREYGLPQHIWGCKGYSFTTGWFCDAHELETLYVSFE